MGVLTFQLTQANRQLEIKIEEMKTTYQTLREEFNHISSYFDVVHPAE
ncbi:putative membrane protein [Thermotoga neapolitana DSM 4359]